MRHVAETLGWFVLVVCVGGTVRDSPWERLDSLSRGLGAAPAHTGELWKAELGPWLVWSWGVCKVRSWDTSSLLVADEFG